MHPLFARSHARPSLVASALRHATHVLLIALLLSDAALGQVVRPGPGTGPVNPGGGAGGGPGAGGGGPGGGGVGGGGIGGGGPGGGGGGFPINPIFPNNPGAGIPITGPRIVTDSGMLVGRSMQASVTVPNSPATAAEVGQQTGAATATATTYQWTISGGRILSDATQSSVRFTADTPGTVSLNVVVIAGSLRDSAATEVVVFSPALAGTMTAPPTVTDNAATITATVPAAQNGDRTFRWTLAGNGAAIASGQGTNRVTLRPGAPGLLEVTCDVTLQRAVTVAVRSFVVVSGNGPPIALTVNDGTGSGTFPAGSRVDIFADPPAAGQVFDKWIGDTAILGSAPLAPSLRHAVVNVPAASATLTATYKPAAEWTPAITSFQPIAPSPAGTTLTYHVPADAKGLVFLLHDTGGVGSDWFTRPEQLMLVRDLVAAGYGAAALNSVSRSTGAWSIQSTLATNPDAATLAAALDHFEREGAIAADTPVFLLGIADGGDAAARFAQQLAAGTPSRAIKGTVSYCAAGEAAVAATSRVPHLFALAAHDDALGAAGNAAARANAQLLTGRGVATAMVTNSASPVPAGRLRALGMTFARFSAADAETIWSALRAATLLDANNYPKSVPTVEAVRAALPAAFQAMSTDVVAQLAVAFGAQEFFSDANARVLTFLDNRIADVPAPAPGRLVNLSTRTQIAYLGDTFVLGFTLTGPQPATLLIRGIGPALTRFGIAAPLPAPKLEIHRGRTLVAANQSWDTSGNDVAAAAAQVGAFALPRGSLDTAVLLTLDPGTYTATITSINGAVGDVLAEIYDVSRNATRLTNLSNFATIGAERESLVHGIVVAGNNPRTLVVRAIGPGLSDLGFSANTVLSDPRLSIATRTGQMVAANNDWTQTDPTMLSSVFAAVGAFPLKATNGDAALVNAFTPGSYILQTAAAPVTADAFFPLTPAAASGAVLVELYEVP